MMNWTAIIIATIIPLALGFLWYGKMMFFNAWSAAADINMDSTKKVNMAIVMPVLLVLSFLLSMALLMTCVHQFGLGSLLALDGNADAAADLKMMMDKYSGNFRTFKHGAFHGILNSIFFALPIISFHALFEGKKAKYILIHWGYWLVCMMLMCGVLCAMK
jgi:Protein of unknown function (DUF1761)